MKAKDLLALGFPQGPVIGVALRAIGMHASDGDPITLEADLKRILAEPKSHLDHPQFAQVARELVNRVPDIFIERAEPVPLTVWGEGLEEGALKQMHNA
ncbi:MAG TPA: hypothetical protein PKB10_08680, partial [Tepidisphaeraceae bacterium]|nr:hypothetical protein [Tepidisphaeraceae bacterium]